MSLKTKIPLLVAAMLFLNIIIVILYNRLYFLDKVAEKIEHFSGRFVDAEKLRGSSAIWELVILEIVVIGIIVFAIGVVVYLIYARPLINLNKMVSNYKNGEIENTLRKDEIGQLQNSFHQLYQSLHKEKLIQNRMIASISHDIKTPLTSVLGYSESLIKKSLSIDKQRQYLTIIHNRALDIEYIVTEFDNYIAGKLCEKIVKKPIKVSYIATMLVEEYEPEACTIKVINLCDEHYEIDLDLPQIRRVFANLVKNSIKHNSHKPDLAVEIILNQSNGKFYVSIEDNGKSVSSDIIPLIFEPFYSTITGETITGLGLSICKDIIENHGGKISAVNTDSGFMVSFSI